MPVADNYYALTDEQQEAACLRMAEALIAGLGEHDSTGRAAEDENPDKES